MEGDEMELNNRIKQLREGKELSQEQLSIILETKRATLGNWETGRAEPDINMLNKMANYFSVSVDYLMGRTDEMLNGVKTEFEGKIYGIIGSSDFAEEERRKILENFETMVAGIKAQRNK
jgi:transcriptional regulator with XRE-family HTH domain